MNIIAVQHNSGIIIGYTLEVNRLMPLDLLEDEIFCRHNRVTLVTEDAVKSILPR